MQYKITHGEKGQVDIKVDVPAEAFDATYADILSQFVKETNVDGFRPGMAPLEVVENQVGLSKILNKAASHLISTNLSEIFKKENLIPLDSPKVGIDSLAKGTRFSFSASFIKKPQVTISDWKNIKVKKIKAKEITDEDVNKSIANIYEAWKKQKGTVGHRDEGTKNIKGTNGGQIAEGTEETESTEDRKYIYDARGRKIFLEETKGQRDGGTKDKSELVSDKSERKVDDEFAKAIGARDLVHLKELVKKDLETLVGNQIEAELEKEIFDKLAEIGTVDIPDILVDDELNRMIVRLNSELERTGKKIEEWLVEQKTTFVELRSKWRDQAAKNVKITLIMDEIGKDEKIQVAKEELEKSMANVNNTKLSDEQKHDLENYMVMSIFQAKTLDLIKKAVSV